MKQLQPTSMHLDLQKKFEILKKFEESKSTTSEFKCQFCDFKASRINVIILHTKSHSVPKTSGTDIDTTKGGNTNKDNFKSKESVVSSKKVAKTKIDQDRTIPNQATQNKKSEKGIDKAKPGSIKKDNLKSKECVVSSKKNCES